MRLFKSFTAVLLIQLITFGATASESIESTDQVQTDLKTIAKLYNLATSYHQFRDPIEIAAESEPIELRYREACAERPQIEDVRIYRICGYLENLNRHLFMTANMDDERVRAFWLLTIHSLPKR